MEYIKKYLKKNSWWSILISIIIGIWILYSAITKLGISIKLKNIKVDIWIYGLILSIIMIACGLTVLNELKNRGVQNY